MIKIENTEVFGWEAAIRGMRNPMNSWDKSDSYWTHIEDAETQQTAKFEFFVGDNDLKLMKKLANAGSDHGKFLRYLDVTADITCMQPWWFEFDTYKIATVRNSCSKMHKIHVKPFTYDDFSHEGIDEVAMEYPVVKCHFQTYIDMIEWMRVKFNETHEKKYWRALIEMLPEGYNMKATVQLNYQVLKAMYHARKNHKLIEWHDFCAWCESLPYFMELCGE